MNKNEIETIFNDAISSVISDITIISANTFIDLTNLPMEEAREIVQKEFQISKERKERTKSNDQSN